MRLDEKNADAWLALGRALRSLNEWAEAEGAYEKAIALRPQWEEAYFGLAEPLQRLNRLDEAEAAYRKAIELNPKLADAYTFLARLLERTGRLVDAENALRLGVKNCPDSPRIHSFLGEHLFRKKHDAYEAKSHFEEAVRLMPSYVEAMVGLAGTQRHLAKEDPAMLAMAITNNKIVVTRDPDNENAYLGLGLCYVRQKAWSDASRAFREATRCKGDMAAAWYYRAFAARRAGEQLPDVLGYLATARMCQFDAYRCDVEVARALAEHNKVDEALSVLASIAKSNGGILPQHLRRDRAFGRIVDQPRFKRLYTRIAAENGE